MTPLDGMALRKLAVNSFDGVPVQVIKRRGDPDVIREAVYLLDGAVQKLRVTFDDGMEIYLTSQGLRAKANEVAP